MVVNVTFEEIAREVIDEKRGDWEYDELGEIAYYQTATNLANYAFEMWETALFVAFENVVEEEMRKLGHVPID